jgi:hypothetical protein
MWSWSFEVPHRGILLRIKGAPLARAPDPRYEAHISEWNMVLLAVMDLADLTHATVDGPGVTVSIQKGAIGLLDAAKRVLESVEDMDSATTIETVPPVSHVSSEASQKSSRGSRSSRNCPTPLLRADGSRSSTRYVLSLPGQSLA